MRRNIIEEYPSVKDIEVVLKQELGRVEAQEFLREDKKLFVHSGDATEVAETGKHLLYDKTSLVNLKKELAGRSRTEKSTAFVVESESSLDSLEGDLNNLKEDDEVFDEDSDLKITDTQRSEHSIDVQVSYVHRKASNRTLQDSTSRSTSFKIYETEEDDDVYKVTQNFFHADEFDATKKLFNQWDRRRKIDGKSGVSRADIRIEAITPLEERVNFFDDFLTYNPNSWDTRTVQHLGVRQSDSEVEDETEAIDTGGNDLEDQIDQQLSNITELALTGKSLRENPIVEKCIDNDFYFDAARIYCENTSEARGVEVELKFKRRGRNAFDLSISKEYELVEDGKNREPFSPQFRDKTRNEFRNAVIDLFGEYKDMPNLVDERGEAFSLTDLPNIGETLAENIRNSGFGSVSEVLEADQDELTEIDGIGKSKAESILGVES
jgi:hypothetical protein